MTLANLTHGYEMISTPIASSTGAVSFSSTYIHLDTTAFDGTVTYNFEIVATNSNTTTAYSVLLCNTEGTTIGTAPVPASTTNPTRIRVTATGFLAGDDAYYIKAPATSVASQVKVYTARIIISQTNATKTRVQIPLTTNNYALTPVTADTALMTSTSITFVNLTNAYEYAMWKYTAANWTNVGSFILEAVTKSSNASGITSVSLNGIANTTATKTGTTLYVAQDTFNTTDLADGTSYKLQIKSNSASYTTSFYQANIYVNLSTIGKMEVRQRVHGGISAATTGVATSGSYSRVLIDTINNVNATYAESTGFCADNGTALNIADMGTVDVLGTPTILTGSTINFNSASDAVVTSQLASNPTATHRLQGESVTTTNAKTIGGLTLLYLIVYPFDLGIASSTGTSVVSSNDSTGIRLNERLLGSNTASVSTTSGNLTDTSAGAAKDLGVGSVTSVSTVTGTIKPIRFMKEDGSPYWNLNQRTCGDDTGDLDDFTPIASAVRSLDSTTKVQGTYSLKMTTPGVVLEEGVVIEGLTTLASTQYTVQLWVNIPVGQVLDIHMSNSTWAYLTSLGDIIGTGGWQPVIATWTNGTTPADRIVITNTDNIAAYSFNVDMLDVTLGATAGIWNEIPGGLSTITGKITDSYKLGSGSTTGVSSTSGNLGVRYKETASIVDVSTVSALIREAEKDVGLVTSVSTVASTFRVNLKETASVVSLSTVSALMREAEKDVGLVTSVSTVTGIKLSDSYKIGTGLVTSVSAVSSIFRVKLKETASVVSLSTVTGTKLSDSYKIGTGLIADVSTVTGVKLTDLTKLQGTSAGISTVSSIFRVNFKETGSVISLSTVSASMREAEKDVGLVTSVSTVTGIKLSDSYKIGTGLVTSVSAVSSIFRVKLKETASVVSLSTVTGTKLSDSYKIGTSLVTSVSTVTGVKLLDLTKLFGLVTDISTVSGIKLSDSYKIGTGTITSTSGVSGLLRDKEKDVGSITGTSSASGNLGVKYKTVGSIIDLSTVIGILKSGEGESGLITGQSIVNAKLDINYKLTSLVNSVSSLSGLLRDKEKDTGLINALTTVVGNVTCKFGEVGLITGQSNIIANLKDKISLQGSTDIISEVTGSMSLDVGEMADISIVSSTYAELTDIPSMFMIGEVNILSDIEARIDLALMLQGIIDIFSSIFNSLTKKVSAIDIRMSTLTNDTDLQEQLNETNVLEMQSTTNLTVGNNQTTLTVLNTDTEVGEQK